MKIENENMDNVTWEAISFENGKVTKMEKKLVAEIEYKLILNGRLFEEITCSPWQLEELAVGILYMHHVVSGIEDIGEIKIDEVHKEIHVKTTLVVHRRMKKGSYESVVSGKAIEAKPQEIIKLAKELEKGSARFHLTGGVHSAALADNGEIILFMEDVGRHNAMDKLMGACLMKHIDPTDKLIVFSGRVASEIMMKAIEIGSPMIIALSAPTERSSRLAQDADVTLIGFARGETFNVYTHAERVDFE